MTLDEFTDQLRRKVAKNEIEEALQIAIDKLRQVEGSIYNRALLLQNQCEEVLRQESMGTIDTNDKIIQQNKILASFLDLIDDMEKDGRIINLFNPEQGLRSEQEVKPKRKKRFFTISFSLSIAFTVLLLITGAMFILRSTSSGVIDDELVGRPADAGSNSKEPEDMVDPPLDKPKPESPGRVDLETVSVQRVQIGELISDQLDNPSAVKVYGLRTALHYRNLLAVRLTNRSRELAPVVQLFNKDRKAWGDPHHGQPGADLQFTAALEPNQPYFIRITPRSGRGSFDLFLELEENPSGYTEGEPNDSPSSASALNPDQPVLGFLTPQDLDFYMFRIDKPGSYRIRYDNRSDYIIPQLSLFNQQKKRVAGQSASAFGQSLSLQFEARRPGTYRIKVEAYQTKAGSYGDYRLLLEETFSR